MTYTDKMAHVGQPVRSRSSGVWIIPVSRRLDNPDGSFAGVALVAVRIAFFRSFYESFAIGEKDNIYLASDGRFLVRRPFRENDIGRDVSKGPVFRLWREKGETASAIMSNACIPTVTCAAIRC
jgi:hypothetical protein